MAKFQERSIIPLLVDFPVANMLSSDHMTQHKVIPLTLEKFARLADFLEQASKAARELSQTKLLMVRTPTLKRPRHVPPDEEWFWSEEWQAGEREANEDLVAGRFTVFDTVEEALRWLKE